ncbi:MAG: glycosyltransferase family 39 protein [Nitrospinota bacterium]
MAFAVDYLEGWDSVDFALALDHYSLSEQQPHFPGYPVYIWIARTLRPLFTGEASALAATSALFGGLALLPFFGLARTLFGPSEAIAATLFFLFTPLQFLAGTKALSDATGLFFLLTFLWLALCAQREAERPGGWVFAGLAGSALALTLGVRLSYTPFVLTGAFLLVPWLRASRSSSERLCRVVVPLAAFTLSAASWLWWQMAQEGVRGFWTEALRFTEGHFGEWGGTVVTNPDIGGRLAELFRGLFVHGLGFWEPGSESWRWLATLTVGGVVLAGFLSIHTASRSKVFFLASWLIPYGVWVLLAQNPGKPRHLLPLVPLFLMCGSVGARRLAAAVCNLFPGLEGYTKPIGMIFVGLATLGPALTSIQLARVHKAEPAPALQMVQYIRERFGPGEVMVFLGEEKRLFDYYAPAFFVERLRSAADAEAALAVHQPLPQAVFFTSGIHGLDGTASSTPKNLQLVRVFSRNPYVHPAYSRVALYRLHPQLEEGHSKP